jgi:hypothetical protein
MKRLIAAGLAVALSVGQAWAQTETAGGAATGAGGAAVGTAAVAQSTVFIVFAASVAVAAATSVSGSTATHH